MLKKMGMVGVGVTAGLLVASPFASASESGHGEDGHDNFNASCAFNGGHADAASEVSGDAITNIVEQAPIAGNNVGNIADCSSFLNDNLNGNFSGNHAVVFSDDYLPQQTVKSEKASDTGSTLKSQKATGTSLPLSF